MTARSILTTLFLAAALQGAAMTASAAERLGSLVVGGKTVPLLKSDIVKAEWGYSHAGSPVVNVSFSAAMTLKFCKLTAENISKQMILKIRGKVVVDAAIQSKICGGNLQITGGFSTEDVQRMARQLQGK